MPYRILVVDDEADIVQMLQDLFTMKGYQVLAATGGKQALALCSQKPDLILLDVNMPDMDGFTLCRQIRDFVSCPILFLTARIEDADKVKGFAAGGDDYILKPFSSQELLARVAAHLRREERRQGQAQVKFDQGLIIDYGSRCLYQDGQLVHLAKKEFDIVELLSMHPSQVFDRERIYESVWGWDSEGDSAVVAEHIRRIRAKFAAAGCGGPHCHCVGRGLQMAVKLFQKKAPSGGRAPWRRRVSLRWALVLTTVLCALGAFLFIALESWGLEWARDALHLKYITPYYADEMETGEYYTVSPDGTLLYVEATMPYAYVDPDTGEIYPIETTSPTCLSAGPLRFFYKNVGQIAVCAFVLTAALAFLIDAWWFYRWKIKKPLAVLNNASKIAQNDLDFHVESPALTRWASCASPLRPCGPL